MVQKLKISDTLSLPLDVVTQKLGWIGTTGSGKTYGATKLAELLFAEHAQFVVLDPVGVWYGLRIGRDGKKPSDIKIPIFGGLHGDVPLESGAGGMMADLIVDRTLTCILDVSQFESDSQKAKFAADFADRFFFRKKASPSAVHLFIEECQEFVPENQQRGEERMLHAFVRLQKIGRNFGIGTSYITQRPQEVAKKALNLAQTLFVFRCTGTHERRAIESWIKDKAIEGQDISTELPKLKTGAPHVWSPEWLQISEVVHILEKRTFNASATPEVGAAAVTRELASIDLEKIRDEMAATIERAKADDPKELKRRIADLEKQLASKGASKPERKEVPVLTKEHVGEIRRIIKAFDSMVDGWNRNSLAISGGLKTVTDGINKLQRVLEVVSHPLIEVNSAPSGPQVAPLQYAHQIVPTPRSKPDLVGKANDAVSSGQQRILDSIATLAALGIPEPTKPNVAALAVISPKSSTLRAHFAALKDQGLIYYAGSGSVGLTDTGRGVAKPADSIGSLADLHSAWCGLVKDDRRAILERLIVQYPHSWEKDKLGTAVGISPSSSTLRAHYAALVSLGAAEYPAVGLIKASSILFPAGMAR